MHFSLDVYFKEVYLNYPQLLEVITFLIKLGRGQIPAFYVRINAVFFLVGSIK